MHPPRFTLKLAKSLPLDATAPLLCAGITTYSPMRHFGLVSGAAAASSRFLLCNGGWVEARTLLQRFGLLQQTTSGPGP
jgi:hypothetical protein